ncbi:MAG: hypothetical protein IPO01_07220 [Chitinophagaceae bacterium]|nr:hypothetical protein [Chitinophagaceae bacterium]
MVFVLRAPNSAILNLDYFISSTGGNGPSTGFTNTVFSTAGTAVLATGISPYTGTFKADALVNQQEDLARRANRHATNSKQLE